MNGVKENSSDNLFIDMGIIGFKNNKIPNKTNTTKEMNSTILYLIDMIEEDQYVNAFNLLVDNMEYNDKDYVTIGLTKMILFEKIKFDIDDQVDYMKNKLFPLLDLHSNYQDSQRKKEIFKFILEDKQLIKSEYYSVLKSKFNRSIIEYMKAISINQTFINYNSFYEFQTIEISKNEILHMEEEIIVLMISYINENKNRKLTFDDYINNYSNFIVPQIYSTELIDKFLSETKKIVFIATRDENVFKRYEDKNLIDSNKIEESTSYKNFMSLQKEKKNVKVKALKNFNFRFTKRENIDKKVLRKFRKYLRESIKKKLINLDERYEFLKLFVKKNLFPPFEYNEYQFKSFNTKYLMWLFSQPHFANTFNSFIENTGNRLIQFLYTTFNVNSFEDKLFLSNYVMNLSVFYINENIFCSDKVNSNSLLEKNNRDSLPIYFEKIERDNNSNENNNDNQQKSILGDDLFFTQEKENQENVDTLGDLFVEYGLDFCSS